MKSTVVFSMISDIFFPAQLFNIHFFSIKFVHIKSIDFILQSISLLSYNSLNGFILLLILVHLLLIVGLLMWGRDIFADVGLLPGFCGFVLAAPAQQHTRRGGQCDPQSTSRREGRAPKDDPTIIKTQLHSESNINGIKGMPRPASSGDQGDYTTESHRSPTIEFHSVNPGSQYRSI